MSDSGVMRALVKDIFVRGMMAGALLGIATSLAITGAGRPACLLSARSSSPSAS